MAGTGHGTRYEDELREKALRMVMVEGKTLNQTAIHLGVRAGAIGRWVAKAKGDERAEKSGQSALIDSLTTENRQLRDRINVLTHALVAAALLMEGRQ